MEEHSALKLGAPISYKIEDVPKLVGLSRTRVFEAIRTKRLTARKAGRSTIVEADALLAWVRSLPTTDHPHKRPDGAAA